MRQREFRMISEEAVGAEAAADLEQRPPRTWSRGRRGLGAEAAADLEQRPPRT